MLIEERCGAEGERQFVRPTQPADAHSSNAAMTYRLQSMAMYSLYAAVVPCLAVLTGIFWLWITIAQPPGSRGGGPVWFGVLWLAWVLWALKRYVTMPHTIEITDDGYIKFVGTFHTTVVTPSAVVSVKAFAGQFVYINHSGGKILLLAQFTGFHAFLTRLKQENSQVSMNGV